VTFTQTDANYEAVSPATQAVTVTVKKAAAPTITWPTAAEITYGDALSAATLSVTSNAYGTFAWDDADYDGSAVLSAGTYTYDVTFTQTDANYEAVTPATQAVTVTVKKAAAPTITWPTTAGITYGQTLADAVLIGGSTAYGSFAFAAPDTKPAVPGGAFAVTFTPNAATVQNYETITTTSQDVNVLVFKAPAPTIAWPAASAITYGQTLAASTLSGGSTEYGSFAWTDSTIAPPAGAGSYAVTFTPSADTANNYQPITTTSANVDIVVNKAAAPTITWPTAAEITYGDALSAATLSFTSNAYGTFAWDDADYDASAVLNAGTYTYDVTFTQTDANYEAVSPATQAVTVTVKKAAAPVISWPTSGSPIFLGQTLASSTLDLTSNAYGTFAWTDPTEAPAASGSFSVTFTQTNTNYEQVAVTTQLIPVTVVTLPGDVDLNGVLDARDALMALRAAMGIITLTPAQLAAVDIDQSGTITAADASNVARLVAGLPAIL
jgi:hypothetical protein